MLRNSAVLVLLALFGGPVPRARAGEPPASPAPAPTHADLARRLRSSDARERARGITELALVEPTALRQVLSAAAEPTADLGSWSAMLLGLAREARGARQRELVRALLAARARLRAASVPPKAPSPPAGDRDRAYVLDLRFVQARAGALAAIVGPPSASKAPRLLAEADLARALAAGEAAKDATLLGGPALAVVGSGDTSIAVTRQRAYVERYEVVVGAEQHPVVSPVVDTLEEGLRCAAAALPAAGESITFRLRMDLFEASEPLDEFDAPLAVPGRAEDLTVRVQVPDLRTTTLERAVPLVRDLWTVVGVADPPLSRGVGSVVVLARVQAQPAPGPAPR